eukprot:1418568-Rhodomonas_salina.1
MAATPRKQILARGVGAELGGGAVAEAEALLAASAAGRAPEHASSLPLSAPLPPPTLTRLSFLLPPPPPPSSCAAARSSPPRSD